MHKAWTFLVMVLAFAPDLRAQIVINVDSTVDAGDAMPGDGACASNAGECTLRAALQEVRARPAQQATWEVRVPPGVYVLSDASVGPLVMQAPMFAQGLNLVGWAPGQPAPEDRPIIVPGPGFNRQLLRVVGGSSALFRVKDVELRGARVAPKDAQSPAEPGAALGCDSGAAAILDIERVRMSDNQNPQAIGGALHSAGCVVRMKDVEVDANCGVLGAITYVSPVQSIPVAWRLERVSLTRNNPDCTGGVQPQFHALSVLGLVPTEQWDIRLENVTFGNNHGAMDFSCPQASPSQLRKVSLRNVTVHGNSKSWLGTDALVAKGDVEVTISHASLGDSDSVVANYARVVSKGRNRARFTASNGGTVTPHATDFPNSSNPGLGSLQRVSPYTLGFLPMRAGMLDGGAGAASATDLALCALTDQASMARPKGDACDIGALESDWLFGDGFE